MMKIGYTRFIFLIIVALIASQCNVIEAQEKLTQQEKHTDTSDTTKFGSWKQMQGSKVADTKYGDVNIRIYTYIRYLNQMGLDLTFTNSFGQTFSIDKRQDMQMQKASIYFSGWFLDPKFRYFLYVWTCNASQGQGAQVVLAGNLSYNFNKHFALRAGIMSLPGVRSTEGNYPFWLSVDNRKIGDEFFRPILHFGHPGVGTDL